MSRRFATLDSFRLKLADRSARSALEHQLRGGHSPAQLAEMNAILARYDGADTYLIKTILRDKRAA